MCALFGVVNNVIVKLPRETEDVQSWREIKFKAFGAKLKASLKGIMSPLKTILQLQNQTFRKELSQPGISNGIIKKLIIGLKMLQETRDHLNDTLTFEEPLEKDQGQSIQELRKIKYKDQNHSCCHQWLSKHDYFRDCHHSGLQGQ